jgi:hypothetical protein
MGTKSFVQIDINAVFTSTSGKMQFRSGVFDHFKRCQFDSVLGIHQSDLNCISWGLISLFLPRGSGASVNASIGSLLVSPQAIAVVWPVW